MNKIFLKENDSSYDFQLITAEKFTQIITSDVIHCQNQSLNQEPELVLEQELDLKLKVICILR